MKWFCLLLLLGCATPRSGTIPADPPTAALAPQPAPVTIAPPTSATLDEATVKAKTRAWFDAFDRADSATVEAELGPSYVEFMLARWYDRKQLLDGLRARNERHAPLRSRTWSAERVQLGPNVAVFEGEAAEHQPAEG